MKKLTPPLKFHGGKYYLAPSIIKLMPPHLTYAEPFFGGGHVLIQKDPEGVNEIVNDINTSLIQFWHVMREPDLFYAFRNRVASTPFGPWMWEVACTNAKTVWKHFDDAPNYSNLIAYVTNCFVLWRQSLAGRGDAPAPLSTFRIRRGMNEQVSAWVSTIEGLPAVHQRLMRVAICNEDFEEFINRVDTPKTLFYCDPPYLQATRKSKNVYEHEMTVDDHRRLLDTLGSIKGKFILSGYPSSMYETWAKKRGWHTRSITVPNNAAGGKKKRMMQETLWMNYEPPATNGKATP